MVRARHGADGLAVKSCISANTWMMWPSGTFYLVMLVQFSTSTVIRHLCLQSRLQLLRPRPQKHPSQPSESGPCATSEAMELPLYSRTKTAPLRKYNLGSNSIYRCRLLPSRSHCSLICAHLFSARSSSPDPYVRLQRRPSSTKRVQHTRSSHC